MPNRLHLTDLAIKSLKPGIHWDTTLKAFGIRIGKKARTFIIVRDGGRRTKIGRYPKMNLTDARKKARRLLDVESEPDTSPRTTFKQAADSYLDLYVTPNYRPRTAYLTKRLLTKYTEDLVGKPIRSLTPEQFTEIFDDLLGTPSEANHLYGALRTFFAWCEQRQLITTSPLQKVSKPAKDKSRSRTLNDNELRTIWRACPNNYYGAIVKLLILTGQRRGEIAALQKTWISPTSITWPPEAVKNGAEHTIPLTQEVSAIIAKYTPDNCTYLFPARGGEAPYNGWGKAKAALDTAIQDEWAKQRPHSPMQGWTLHDLRRTFSTKMAEWDICPPHITEAILNHRTGSRTPIQRIYDRHTYLPQMRTALEAYQAHLLLHVLR